MDGTNSGGTVKTVSQQQRKKKNRNQLMQAVYMRLTKKEENLPGVDCGRDFVRTQMVVRMQRLPSTPSKVFFFLSYYFFTLTCIYHHLCPHAMHPHAIMPTTIRIPHRPCLQTRCNASVCNIVPACYAHTRNRDHSSLHLHAHCAASWPSVASLACLSLV